MQGPFRLPMMKDFVPRRLQPWIFVLQLVFFQLAGSIYLGSLAQVQGAYGWLKEDVQMCMNFQLIGMACYFPMVFRNKFRFTNQQLLITAALLVGVGNLLTMHVTFRPLLWLLCFVMGVGKIMGTFENISNLMTWLTPTRNFSTFFPVLNTVLITFVTSTPWFAQLFAYYMHWTMTHWFIMGGMCYVLLVQLLVCRPFCPMPKEKRVPLGDIDFLGGSLWVVFFAQVSYILTFGNHLDWYNSDTVWILTGTALITLALCLYRFFYWERPYYSRELFSRYKNVAAIILIMALVDIIMACRNGMEAVLYGGVLHYTGPQQQWLSMLSIVGVIAGGAFSFWWIRLKHYNPYKLIAIGFLLCTVYAHGIYGGISEQMACSTLYVPLILRGAGYCVLSVVLMWSLNEMVPFEHFFQGLSLFNTFHMWLGSNIGSAVYTELLQHQMTDNASRYLMSPTFEQLTAISIKQIYGGMALLLWALTLLFLLWDMPWVRTSVRKMPSWTTTGIRLAASLPLKTIKK